MSSHDNQQMPETGNDHSVNRTRKFAEWLIAREQAKQAEEPIDRQMRLLKINTFLTLAILVGMGGSDYSSQIMNLLFFL